MDTTAVTTLRYGEPVTQELDTERLPVSGEIPAALRGRFIRNGPNPAPPACTRIGFSVTEWSTACGSGMGARSAISTVGCERPALTGDAQYVRADGSLDLAVGVANTSVVEHAGRVLALVESSLPYELTDDLGTVGAYDFGGRLATPMTAHPKRCPRRASCTSSVTASRRRSPRSRIIAPMPRDRSWRAARSTFPGA